MNRVPDVAIDVARVATAVGLVVAESLPFQDLRALASRTLTAPQFFNRSDTREAEFASSGAMEHAGESQGSTKEHSVGDMPQQPEELFAPHKAEEASEARPAFKSVEAEAAVEPLAQKVALPSVDAAHLPPK